MVAKACINGTREHSRSHSTSGANEHTITIYYSFLGRIEVCPPPQKNGISILIQSYLQGSLMCPTETTLCYDVCSNSPH